MTRRHFSTLLAACLCLGAFGCGASKEKGVVFRYCEEGDFWRREPVLLSFSHSRVAHSDTAGALEVIETSEAKGFLTPFPLALPKPSYAGGSWALGGYTFTAATQNSSGRDGMIIRGRKNADSGDRPIETEVHYSAAGGADRVIVTLGAEHEQAPVVWVSCGARAFNYDDM